MTQGFPNAERDFPGPDLDELLVAYLDGELDADSSREVEDRLAADPEVRRRLQGLERSWDLLEELDRALVGEHFTKTTLEMVAVSAGKEAEDQQAAAPSQQRRRRLLAGAAIALAAAVGFATVALLWPDPNRSLVQDLPVLENLEAYRQIDDIQFLKKLAREGLFDRDRVVSEE